MIPDQRARTGALLGALAAPPLAILGLYPLLGPLVRPEPSASLDALWVAVMFLSSLTLLAGMPILGASVASGGWIGWKAGRRLANYLIGGLMGVMALFAVLRWLAPDLSRGQWGEVPRLIRLEIGLVVGVLLCYRPPKAPPPA